MRERLLPIIPSHTSIICTDGQSRAIASASSIVRFGRLTTSRKSFPDEKLSAPIFWTKIVFGPSSRIESRSDSSNPRMSEVIPTMDVMPMTTPSTVSAERILLVRSVSIDMTTISASSPARSAANGVLCPCGSLPGRDFLFSAASHDRLSSFRLSAGVLLWLLSVRVLSVSIPQGSVNCSAPRRYSLPQRFNRIQRGGAHRRIHPEEQADHRR